MADWIEDDWDASSPIASPSSPLPQSIMEVLESVRAECSAGKFGAYCIDNPTTTMETDVPHEREVSQDEQTMEIDYMKEIISEPPDKTLANSDESGEFSLTGPHRVVSQETQDSALDATNKIHQDFTEPVESNFDTHKIGTFLSQINVDEDENKDREDEPVAKSAQYPVLIEQLLKPTCINIGQIARNPVQQEFFSLKKEKLNLDSILANYQKTKVARWIKIDGPTKKPSPNKVATTTECHQNECKSPPSAHPEESESMSTVELKTQIGGQHDEITKCNLNRKSSLELDVTASRKDTLDAQSVTNKVDPHEKTITENYLQATTPQTQPTQSIDLTDDPESPEIEEVSMKRLKVEDLANISQECSLIQKQGTMVQTGETIELSGDEYQPNKRVHVNTDYIELTDDSQSSEHKSESNTDQTDEQGTLPKLEEDGTNVVNERLADDWMMNNELDVIDRNKISNVKSQNLSSSDDSETSIEVQSPKGSLTYGLPEAQKENNQKGLKASNFHYNTYSQDDANMEWANKSDENSTSDEAGTDEMDLDMDDDETNKKQIKKILPMEQPTNDEALHKELKEKYMNMNFLKETTHTKKEYHEYEPLCEEIEEFARACDESPKQEAENIKIKVLDDDVNTNIAEKNKYEFGDETRANSVTIWRRELLSSDFNLIYGSLRAVLMRNLSKDDRHRLIQTMIATMSEIQEVTMGEGNTTQQSVRCETPESSTGFVKLEEEERESESGEKEETQKEPTSSIPACSKQSFKKEQASLEKCTSNDLRGREMALNVRRIKELTRKHSDGTIECLICKKTGIPEGRVCRACSAMAYRIERNCSIGVPVPTCDHSNYSRAPKCKSCRFRRYCFMSMTATDTRVREVNAIECPVCKKKSYFTRGWKCTKCHYFFLKLTRMEGPLPSCRHDGKFPATCDGCRRYNLQEAWDTNEFDMRYPLPLVKERHHKS